MLVTRILGDCPACGGENKFGNVSVSADHVLRGCIACTHSQHIWLPEIRKTILYLDQFFFSHAFKDRDRRFTDAAQKVREKSERQLLVAPYSSVHEDEARQWRGHSGKDHEDLMEFIKATSGGHEFSPSYQIEKTQIVKAFQAFLNDDPPTYILEERDAIQGDIHKWDDYFRIE